MNQKKTNYNPKSSLSLRIVAGAYLLHIVFQLIKGYGDLDDKDKIFNIAFIGLFTIAGIIILFTAIRSWIRIEKEEKDKDNQEEIQDKDSDEPGVIEESDDIEKSLNAEESKNQ